MGDTVVERADRAWKRICDSLPSLNVGASLCTGARSEELSRFEAEIGFVLPPEVEAFWGGRNGEEPLDAGLAGGFCFVSVQEAKKILDDWASVRERLGTGVKKLDLSTSSRPVKAIQRRYSRPGWIPLLRDLEGNYVGVDLEPGPAGMIGQIINFGRDELDKHVLFPSAVELLEWLAGEIESERIVRDEDEDEDDDETIVHVEGRLIAVMPRPDG